MSIKNTTQVIRNARMALAEKVLSELSRSEEYRLSQGGDTTDDIKAERAKRRKADPKAQRYAGRRVKKVKGQDSQGHGVYRRLAGTKAAKDARANRVGTKVMTANASTEILKKGRMALAERVLEGLMTGSSPTQTGAMAGRFMSKLKGSGADDKQIQKKRSQYHRIKQAASDRQVQNYAKAGGLEKPGMSTDDVTRAAYKVHGAAGGRFAQGYRRGSGAKGTHPFQNPRTAKGTRGMGDVTVRSSTEIIRNSRIALAERVLSCLKEGDIDEGKRWDAVKRGARTAGLVTAAGAAGGLAGHALDKAAPGPWIGNKARAEAPAGPTHKPSKAGNNLSKEINFAADRMPENPLADKKPDTIKTLKRMWKEKDRQKHEQIKNSVLNYLSELKVEAGLKDEARARRKDDPKLSSFHATLDAKRARSDAKIKKVQGKNTPKSVFGGKSNQTSTTAGGGTLGSELAKTKPETQHSMNRKGTSTVDKKKVAANLADAKSGRNTASLRKEIAADNKKRAAKKRAEG